MENLLLGFIANQEILPNKRELLESGEFGLAILIPSRSVFESSRNAKRGSLALLAQQHCMRCDVGWNASFRRSRFHSISKPDVHEMFRTVFASTTPFALNTFIFSSFFFLFLLHSTILYLNSILLVFPLLRFGRVCSHSQMSSDGNQTTSTLSITLGRADSGRYLSCRAYNHVLQSEALEDGWRLDIQCKFCVHVLNIIVLFMAELRKCTFWKRKQNAFFEMGAETEEAIRLVIEWKRKIEKKDIGKQTDI